MANVESGVVTLRRLMDALGIDPARRIRRLVIDCPADGICTVYVQEFMDGSGTQAVSHILQRGRAEGRLSVEVAEDLAVDERTGDVNTGRG